MVQQGPDPREEREEAQHQRGQERNGHEPNLAHHLAVEEARAHEVRHVAVEPLHPVEERARCLARFDLRQELLYHVMPEGRVDR